MSKVRFIIRFIIWFPVVWLAVKVGIVKRSTTIGEFIQALKDEENENK